MVDKAKLEKGAGTFGVARTLPSLEAVCESDVTAVALFTQHWLHGLQAITALGAGKDVYAGGVAYGLQLTETAALGGGDAEVGTHLHDGGDRAITHPEAIYCRGRFAAGDFGRIVYGEGGNIITILIMGFMK